MRAADTLWVLTPPYRRLQQLDPAEGESSKLPFPAGAVIIWKVPPRPDGHRYEFVRCRPPGIPLIAILPRAEELQDVDDLLRLIEQCRPQSVLPRHDEPDVLDFRSVLRQPPEDLAADVSEYLTWRGIVLDSDTQRIIRRIVELSAELRTVSGLARSLYLSRRALGRRFLKRGLPVPSHWLQVCRLLRAGMRLQRSKDNIFLVAAALGYPDGFSFSNQMNRLVGVRPSQVRNRLGWEWIFERWLQKEAHDSGFSQEWVPVLLSGSPKIPLVCDGTPIASGGEPNRAGELHPPTHVPASRALSIED